MVQMPCKRHIHFFARYALAIEEPDRFELIMKTAGKALNDFLIGKPLQYDIAEIEQPDVPLWAVWAIQQYAHSQGDEKAFELYGELVWNIINTIERSASILTSLLQTTDC